MFEEQREGQEGRAQRADVGWSGTMGLGKMREAGRGQIMEGLTGNGKEFGFYSSDVFKNCLP